MKIFQKERQEYGTQTILHNELIQDINCLHDKTV